MQKESGKNTWAVQGQEARKILKKHQRSLTLLNVISTKLMPSFGMQFSVIVLKTNKYKTQFGESDDFC